MTEAAQTHQPVPALDLSGVDADVRPQDDLFGHVNGGWLKSAEIPDDQPMTGSFIKLRDEAEKAVNDIITGLSGDDPGTLDPTSDDGKIAMLYASFVDTDAVEAVGAEPIRPLLAEVQQVATTDDLVRLLGRFARTGVSGLFDFDSDADPGDPKKMIMFAAQSGIGLPDESFYREDEYAEIRAGYLEHVTKSFELAGFPDAAEQAGLAVQLETDIAALHWDRVKRRDMRATYNPMTLEELDGSAPGLGLRTFLETAAIDESAFATVIVQEPSFFAEAAKLIATERLAGWKSWAAWKIISNFSPYLSSEFVDERFRFYGTVLNGIPTNKERWKRGVALVEGALGEAVGKIYVDRHFSSVAKERMDVLVANLIAAYSESISELDWMTDETRAKALDKLAKFRPKIGFPAKWRDYSALEIKPGDLIGNVIRAHQFELDWVLSKIGKPVDPDEWFMTPQTVNAYYHPLRNEIVFPAAILQPPFFNEDADDAVNYGGIGAVIGHEIGHGFDDQGSTCDGDGRLINWWTDDDRDAFEQRTKALIAQYDALEPEQTPGHHVNGALTIGENIGDLGGLSIAYRAYKISLQGKQVEPVDGLTDDQRLFFSYAAIWQTKIRTEAVIQRLATDPHSPAEFRCNQIVRNIGQFYEAFEVTEDDALWLAEDQRVKIW
ncbi:M13 family metallopeptidase [Microlunatus soli]|uniref:Endothelin-converting enzyme Metallo peptidase. MEROPS family M13 n=1 Tax=Microlunatus soli TaxID=630515 RepID=A0A1H1W3Q8_9ACTN|nr:M13-type metalloendopeptidase [Microlunatus soli]SDS91928.1 endothelin-converting enzyme Metallo peptidase. MEROPS family M13 [Microlunatus soli]